MRRSNAWEKDTVRARAGGKERNMSWGEEKSIKLGAMGY